MIEVMKLNTSSLPYTNGMRYSIWLNSEVYYLTEEAFAELQQKINNIARKPVVCEFCHGEGLLCAGAGQCDHDGSECNGNNNCGEYTPVPCPHSTTYILDKIIKECE